MSIFNKVPRVKVKRSKFNISYETKLSCNFGDIVPILCQEVLPRDQFKIDTEVLVKFAPLKAPVMHRIKCKIDYFFVPNFQICSNFEKFINSKVNTESSPVVLPYCTPTGIFTYSKQKTVSSLADYLGLPVTQDEWKVNGSEKISILPFLAYQHIYNSFYRDQNLQPIDNENYGTDGYGFNVDHFKSVQGDIINVVDANQAYNLFALRKSCWHKDYFTSALPSPQAGDDVMVPIGGDASVYAEDDVMEFDTDGELPQSLKLNDEGYLSTDDDSVAVPTNLKADLSSASSISINNLRKLFQLQRYKELCERGGTRYSELVANFFGARIPDMFVDRPLYLGGSVQPIKIGEVVQTSAPSYDEELESFFATGNRSGVATMYGRTRTVNFTSVMHGYILGIMRILPEATYQQGLERMWTRHSLYDYAWPQFANIGEQEILNKEIYFGSASENDGIFGYTPRYAEYKENHCHVAGKFRTDLDYWHFGRVFSSLPTLSGPFVSMETMDYDPFYVTDPEVEHCYVDLYNHILAKRPLPYYGTPLGL